MPLSSSTTGSTDLRDTEVQQPKMASTWCCSSSSRVRSANSGQLDAGSTTTGSSCLPSRPPLRFCSSMSISMVSFRVVSEMAMVPDSECSTPTLMVSACAVSAVITMLQAIPSAPACLASRFNFMGQSPFLLRRVQQRVRPCRPGDPRSPGGLTVQRSCEPAAVVLVLPCLEQHVQCDLAYLRFAFLDVGPDQQLGLVGPALGDAVQDLGMLPVGRLDPVVPGEVDPPHYAQAFGQVVVDACQLRIAAGPHQVEMEMLIQLADAGAMALALLDGYQPDRLQRLQLGGRLQLAQPADGGHLEDHPHV